LLADNHLGALSMESGLRAATLRQRSWRIDRRFGLRLLSLPHGDQARDIVGAPTAISRRLVAYTGKTESAVLLEEPKTLDVDLL